MPKMEPVGLDFVERADHVITTEVDIAASRDEVWAALIDNAGWVDWFGCKSCVGQPTTWSAPGDTRTIRVSPLVVDEIAVALEPNERWAMTLVGSNLWTWKRGLEMVELFDTSRQGETRTELRWTGALEFFAISKPLAGLISSRMADAWGQAFENLDGYLRERR